jgi:AbrB family looped-hinge helix DNA binding protein
MNMTIKLQQRGVVTLPKKLRDTLHLEEGQTLRVEQRDGGFFVQPQVTLPTELADAIRESKEDIKNGHTLTFGSVAELHAKLPSFIAKHGD